MAAKKKATEHAQEKEVQITLVKMINADGLTAEVHPAEVENYRAGGFEMVS